jgi:hypothetical protein
VFPGGLTIATAKRLVQLQANLHCTPHLAAQRGGLGGVGLGSR